MIGYLRELMEALQSGIQSKLASLGRCEAPTVGRGIGLGDENLLPWSGQPTELRQGLCPLTAAGGEGMFSV